MEGVAVDWPRLYDAWALKGKQHPSNEPFVSLRLKTGAQGEFTRACQSYCMNKDPQKWIPSVNTLCTNAHIGYKCIYAYLYTLLPIL